MQKNGFLPLWIGFCFLILVGCQSHNVTPQPPHPTTEIAPLEIANPASVYCEQQGGILDIRDQEGGQVGICQFEDGSECEEWVFFRGECQPGGTDTNQLEIYRNETYGFSFNHPAKWSITESDNHISLQHGEYLLFIGFARAGGEIPQFRTGMPAGDFIDSGTFKLLDKEFPKKSLVFEGKTKVVEYGFDIPVDNLRLFIWLDGVTNDYRALDIPTEIIAEADQILTSFSLLGSGTSYP